MDEVATAAPARERVKLRAWWMLIVLSLFYTISFVDRFSLSILAESIRSDLGFTDTLHGAAVLRAQPSVLLTTSDGGATWTKASIHD